MNTSNSWQSRFVVCCLRISKLKLVRSSTVSGEHLTRREIPKICSIHLNITSLIRFLFVLGLPCVIPLRSRRDCRSYPDMCMHTFACWVHARSLSSYCFADNSCVDALSRHVTHKSVLLQLWDFLEWNIILTLSQLIILLAGIPLALICIIVVMGTLTLSL